MMFQNPAAAWALIALAVPVLIHMLVRRRSKATPFPTAPLHSRDPAGFDRAAHAPKTAPLLLIRIGVLGAAAAAIAGPF